MQPSTRIHSPGQPETRYEGQSAINQDAADGGYWHQRQLIEALNNWRSNPLGARLAMALFGENALRAKACGAEPMEDPSAKPDLRAWMRKPDGEIVEAWVSAKLARIGSTDSEERPMHHAARIKFEEADEHGLLPGNDLEIRSALLSHFIDGESIARIDPELRARCMAWLSSGWATAARSAIEGLGSPRATHLVVSLAKNSSGGQLELAGTRCIKAGQAAILAAGEAPKASEPREGQVGTIGGKWMHIQRGQALSSGPQRDIQIKINAAAFYASSPELPEIPSPKR